MSSPGRKMYKRISQRSDPKEPPPALSPLKAKRQRDIKALSPKRAEKGDCTKTKQDRKPRGAIKKNMRDLKTTKGNLKSIDLALPPRSPVAFISWNRGRGIAGVETVVCTGGGRRGVPHSHKFKIVAHSGNAPHFPPRQDCEHYAPTGIPQVMDSYVGWQVSRHSMSTLIPDLVWDTP